MQLPHFPRHTEIVEGNGVQTTRFADWMLLLFTAVNRLIAGIVDGPITAAGGVFERGRSVAMGEWTTPSFAAGDFTSTGGGTAWGVDPGDVTTYAYTLFGNTMVVMFNIQTTDVTGAPGSLNIAIPGGYTATKATRNMILAVDVGIAAIGQARVTAASATIECFTGPAAAPWTATAADATRVAGQIAFEVTPP